MIAYYSPAYDELCLFYYDADMLLVWWDSENDQTVPSQHRTLSAVRQHFAAYDLAHNIIDDTGDA